VPVTKPALSQEIHTIDVGTADFALPEPIHHGPWTIRSRQYAVVIVRDRHGNTGWASTLTRGIPLNDLVESILGPIYLESNPCDAESVFRAALASNWAALSWGAGLRALSLLDLASWDLAARQADRGIAELLGGESKAMPAVTVAGYPPQVTGASLLEPLEALASEALRFIKVPASLSSETTLSRLDTIRNRFPASEIIVDANGAFVSAVAAHAASEAWAPLLWLEDPFQPMACLDELAAFRGLTSTPIGMGDEHSSAYFPEVVLSAGPDVIRLDLTCMGGISRLKSLRARLDAVENVMVSTHMYPHIHQPVLSALMPDAMIEWGLPGLGIDPLADMLSAPSFNGDGLYFREASPGLGEDLPEAVHEVFAKGSLSRVGPS